MSPCPPPLTSLSHLDPFFDISLHFCSRTSWSTGARKPCCICEAGNPHPGRGLLQCENLGKPVLTAVPLASGAPVPSALPDATGLHVQTHAAMRGPAAAGPLVPLGAGWGPRAQHLSPERRPGKSRRLGAAVVGLLGLVLFTPPWGTPWGNSFRKRGPSFTPQGPPLRLPHRSLVTDGASPFTTNSGTPWCWACVRWQDMAPARRSGKALSAVLAPRTPGAEVEGG